LRQAADDSTPGVTKIFEDTLDQLANKFAD
jgi:hypothetical protein